MSHFQGLESWQLDPISFEPKLNYDNYSLWSFKVKTILESRGLWQLVDGTEIAPTEEPALKRWKMRDASARLQFMANIPDKWLWIFKPAASMSEAWITLQEHFKPDSQFKRSLLMRKFQSMKLSEGDDVSSHVQRMGELWQDITVASKEYTAEYGDIFFVATLLNSLPPSWSVFVTMWKVTAEESKVKPATLIGHILDLDAWNRGRAEAHGSRVGSLAELSKRRAKKVVGN
jgi:gag-polypeptide of LTR copia-type